MKDFFIDDWKKAPPSFRFVTTLGILLIINSWVLDHWRSNNSLPFTYFGFDIRQLSYEIGFTIILIAAGAVVFRKIKMIEGPIAKYKKKYSIENLDRDFYLVWFNGKLMLFDNNDKKYYHIYPWGTAEDLNFVSYGTHIRDKFPNPSNPLVKLDNGKNLNTEAYSNGGSINTQK